MSNKHKRAAASVCVRIRSNAMKVTVASIHNMLLCFPYSSALLLLLLIFFLVVVVFATVSERLRMFESCISSNLFGLYWRSAPTLSQFYTNVRIVRPQQRQKVPKFHRNRCFTFMQACTFAPSAINSFTMPMWPPWHATNSGEPPS